MSSYSRQFLSASTNGQPVNVAATSSPGTTIHTAIASSTTIDEIYAWVTNTDSVDRTITIQFGGTTDPDNSLCKAVIVPANSPPIPIISGLCLNNSLVVKAFASVANVLLLTGYTNRIVP